MPHEHEFDPVSGWCLHCTYRSDGRLTGPGGVIYRPGSSNQDQETNHHEVASVQAMHQDR
jgi:hypothetical protein